MKKDPAKKVLSVIIPVYNEEKFVLTLLDKVLHTKVPVSMEILIVNDGSTDRSGELCREWIRTHKDKTGHSLIYLEKPNGGKGSAVKTGIRYSTGDVVIIQDADLEYDPADYEKCIRPILHGECYVVYGSREKENRNRIFSSPFFFLGGLFLTWWIDLLYNADLTDEPTCYKTFSGPLLRSLDLKGDQFDWEPEVTAKLLRMGFTIKEVPVSYYPRKVFQGKKIHFSDGLAGFLTALFWRFASLGQQKKKCADVSAEIQQVLRGKKQADLLFLSLFVFAFLLRLGCALPGLLSPGQKPLMYVDSHPFLAMAGKGSLQEKPKFCTPYPSGFRIQKGKETLPAWERGFNDQTRAPLYVLWLSGLFAIHSGSLIPAVVAGCFLGALSCAVAFLTGNLAGSVRCGVLCGLLMALHPTAILYSALFLPDTLFLLTVSLQVWFFLRFVKNGFGLNLVAAVLFAGLGALIRPVNALWIFPCIGVLLFCKKVPVYLRVNYMLLSLLLFGAVLLPRMWSSYTHGLGFRIDSISSEALMKNTSRLESSLRKVPRYKVLQEYRDTLAKRFAAAPEKFSTLGSRLRERDKMMISKLLEHPWAALASHFNLRTLGPDLTGYFIRFQCHTPQSRKNAGLLLDTFNKIWLLIFLLGIVWYFLAQSTLTLWMKTLLFLALGVYYLLMPGSIAESRYLLPGLPFLCTASAFGLTCLYSLVREQKIQGSL